MAKDKSKVKSDDRGTEVANVRTITPLDVRDEALARATDFAMAREELAAATKSAAGRALGDEKCASELAAPTAAYMLAKDAYAAIQELYDIAERCRGAENLLEYEMFEPRRAFYDAAFPPIVQRDPSVATTR
jgi:hypothetical protein